MSKIQQPFSVIFWNVWVESQLATDKLRALCRRFDELIAKYDPDAFGLNEVLSHSRGLPPLLKHLESRGYRVFFAPFSPEKNGYYGGSAFVSKVDPLGIDIHELGPDKHGERHGYPGHTIKIIRASMLHAGMPVNVVVSYLAHLVPYNWAAHTKQYRNFRALMRMPDLQTGTIIGGDFNRFKFLPPLRGGTRRYGRATGTLLHPTWKLIGKIPLIQANYDNILWTTCGKLLLRDFRVLDRHPSDHAPLYASFMVEP
ncbi:MAG TPA: endonuclease/exonuclease/phosphatase family protein [Patescibacteria group bacterium]|nr:endonuclease/exonuclease/phosphatase family protein [Patescibacteria group bacterium]